MSKDYKKLYEDALSRAKDLHDNHPLGQPQTWMTCEKIFPELREPEDEKIRKEILSFLKEFEYDHYRNLDFSSWIAWLEKQGENNPYSGTSFDYNGHTWGMCAREGGVDILCDSQLIKHIEYLQRESGCEVNFTTKSEDLEEAAHEYSFNIPTQLETNLAWKKETEQHFKDGALWKEQHMKEALQTEYEKGRFDMMEEMMKDAVEGVVHHFPHDELAAVHYNDPKGTPMSIYVSSKGLSAGDKVKIIIVKPEQQ